MARGTAYTFRFHCPTCGVVTTVKCRRCGAVNDLDPISAPGAKWNVKPIHFTERQWEALAARASASTASTSISFSALTPVSYCALCGQ